MTGLEELVAIVEHGSLSAASRALGIPRPTLSRRLDRLEQELGVRLVHRTTRRLTLTREGEVLFDRARHLVRGIHEAVDEVRRLDGTPRGLLRVAVPSEMPAVSAAWLAEFLELYPEVQVEWVAIAGEVDLRAEFDVALRSDAGPDPSLVARTIVRNRRIAVASPRHIDRLGVPTLATLATHPLIRGVEDGRAVDTWPLRAGGRVRVSGRLVANQQGMRIEAARLGLGVALVTDRIVADDLAEGRLVHVAPDIGRDERVSLVYADRRFLDPKVRAFVDHFGARIRPRA